MLLMLAQETIQAANNDVYFIWGCVLFGVAIGLLCLEFFVPSGGLIAILCGVAAVGSVVAFYRFDPWWGIGSAVAYIVLAPIVIVFFFKLWINSPLARIMILDDKRHGFGTDEEGERVAPEHERRERLEAMRDLIGAEGETETALRPVGTVRIGGQRLDGFAEGGVIPANTPIVVTDVYDNQVKVRPR
jgi:membrane-bound serine protease (ClpP class)